MAYGLETLTLMKYRAKLGNYPNSTVLHNVSGAAVPSDEQRFRVQCRGPSSWHI